MVLETEVDDSGSAGELHQVPDTPPMGGLLRLHFTFDEFTVFAIRLVAKLLTLGSQC